MTKDTEGRTRIGPLGPLTDNELWFIHDVNAMLSSSSWPTSSLIPFAHVMTRFEKSLTVRDKQINTLVNGILSIDEWTSGRNCHICPFCKGMYDEHKDGCLRGVAEAIKEATDDT